VMWMLRRLAKRPPESEVPELREGA
jgi:hypothetical protein